VRRGTTLADLVAELGLGKRRIAVEVNRDIIPRDEYATCRLQPGDTIEIVHFVAVANPGRGFMKDPFVLAGKEYRSRLIVGTGKYKILPRPNARSRPRGQRSSPWRSGG